MPYMCIYSGCRIRCRKDDRQRGILWRCTLWSGKLIWEVLAIYNLNSFPSKLAAATLIIKPQPQRHTYLAQRMSTDVLDFRAD